MTPPSRGPPSRSSADTYSTAETVSEEGASPMAYPPDPSDVPLRARGGTLEPVTGRSGGSIPAPDVARLRMAHDALERRTFRVEGVAVAALLLWLGTMVLACAGAGWRLAGW